MRCFAGPFPTMSLRQQLQKRSAAAAGLLRDGGLLQALHAELTHELSNPPADQYKPQVGESVRGFTVEWDDPRTQDVVLRRWIKGEEVAVSALLAPLRFRGEDPLPRSALMKICVKKPAAGPVLHFNCSVARSGMTEAGQGGGGCGLAVERVGYYPSIGSWRSVKYKGPKFSLLDPKLQGALKDYLADRGIDMELSDFLLRHLCRKEQAQYVNWLQNLESSVAKVH